MKLDIFSDVHLKPSDVVTNFIPEHIDDDCVAIVAGDTSNGFHDKKRFEFLKELDRSYNDRVVVVQGNHDYYGHSIDNLIPGSVFDILGYKIVTATLWTNFRNNPMVELQAMRDISDFYWITGMNAAMMKSLFEEDRNFLIEHKNSDVVVTHFPVLALSEHPQYKGDPLNGYFVNHDIELVEMMNAKVWIHGHTHNSFDYEYGNTRFVCNPRGYTSDPNHKFYKPKRIEI